MKCYTKGEREGERAGGGQKGRGSWGEGGREGEELTVKWGKRVGGRGMRERRGSPIVLREGGGEGSGGSGGSLWCCDRVEGLLLSGSLSSYPAVGRISFHIFPQYLWLKP